MGRQKRKRESAIGTLVGKDTRVHGDLEFTGGCLIDGYVKGNVKAISDENAMLSISERGEVEGAVIVPNVLLNGTVKGDVKASRRVELGSNARVVGNVQYSLIEMAMGAEINGKLIHEPDSSEETVDEILSSSARGDGVVDKGDDAEPPSGSAAVAKATAG
ncbi:MAG: polymer-forming cytoskeletal protein [Gammaproteobacteria bacterium]|jgi:cytoskeletal protein CcmA (bactofilin family)